MSGLFMMIHASTALLSSICLVAFVLLFSNSNQLSLEELLILLKEYKQNKPLNSQIMLKVLYWLIIALILPAMLSIILMLYPLFGTDGLEFLADVHRWSVLLLTICVIFVQYNKVLQKYIENTKGV
jgi:predicted transporter